MVGRRVNRNWSMSAVSHCIGGLGGERDEMALGDFNLFKHSNHFTSLFFSLPMRTFLWNAFDNKAMSTVDSFGTVEVCRNKRSSVPRHFLMYSPDEGLGGTETLCFLYLIAGINVSRVLRLFVYCYYVPWNGTHTFL